MEMRSGDMAGALVVCALVALGLWYVRDTDVQDALQNGAVLGERARPGGPPSAFARRVDWSADGRSVLVLSRDETKVEGRVALHDTAAPRNRIAIDLPGEVVGSAALAADGRHVLAGTCQGRLWWLDVASEESLKVEEFLEPAACNVVALAPDGYRFAAGSAKGAISIYEPPGRSIRLPVSRKSSVADLYFSHDGRFLLSALNDGAIELWDLKASRLARTLAGHERSATSAAFLRDGRRIISAGLDDTIRIWNIETGAEDWRAEFGLGGVRALAVSADGRTAAWAGFSRRIILWDLEQHRKRYEISTPASMIAHLKFSPDGTLLAMAGTDQAVRIYEVKSGAESLTIPLEPAH